MRDPLIRRHVWCYLYDKRHEKLLLGDSGAVSALKAAREEWARGYGFSEASLALFEEAKQDYEINPSTYAVESRDNYGLALG